MQQLRVGKVSTKELSDWMGVKYKTFRNQKKRKLEELRKFCDFEEVYGGVFIKQIYDACYKKDAPNDQQVFLHEIKISNEGLSSVAGMARKLRRDSDYYGNLSQRQVQRRMGKMNAYFFGTYGENEKEAVGRCGSRRYIFAIKLDDFNHYRRLTEEEKERFYHIVKSVCGKQTDKIIESMLLEEAFKNSDMTKEEYLLRKERFGLSLFPDVLRQFKIETGFVLVRIQEYKLNAFLQIAN